MAHKKSSAKKPLAAKNTPAKRKRVSAAPQASKTTSSKPAAQAVPAVAKKINASVYEQMAQRTLGLWREQLATVSRSPVAMHEMGKMMSPVFSMFTQGMDMWLMMADPFSKGASAFTSGFAVPNDVQKSQTSSTKTAAKKSGKGRAKPAAEQPAPITSPVVAGASAMAELARRIANMERQRAATAAQSRTTGTKTAAVIGFEEAVGHRRRRVGKA